MAQEYRTCSSFTLQAAEKIEEIVPDTAATVPQQGLTSDAATHPVAATDAVVAQVAEERTQVMQRVVPAQSSTPAESVSQVERGRNRMSRETGFSAADKKFRENLATVSAPKPRNVKQTVRRDVAPAQSTISSTSSSTQSDDEKSSLVPLVSGLFMLTIMFRIFRRYQAIQAAKKWRLC